MPSNYIAYLIVYNEEDIIQEIIDFHLKQGINFVIVDNGSTDNTWEIIQNNRFRIGILKTERIETSSYGFQFLIFKAFCLVEAFKPDWVLQIDANTFLEPPMHFRGTLSDFITRADNKGYNIINLTVYDFYPTKKDNLSIKSVYKRMQYYNARKYFNLSQIQEKIFKYYPGLKTTDGHTVILPRGVKRYVASQKSSNASYCV